MGKMTNIEKDIFYNFKSIISNNYKSNIDITAISEANINFLSVFMDRNISLKYFNCENDLLEKFLVFTDLINKYEKFIDFINVEDDEDPILITYEKCANLNVGVVIKLKDINESFKDNKRSPGNKKACLTNTNLLYSFISEVELAVFYKEEAILNIKNRIEDIDSKINLIYKNASILKNMFIKKNHLKAINFYEKFFE